MTDASRQASPIRRGDFVAYTDAHNVVRWGIAVSDVDNDGPWPQIRIDFQHEQGEPRLVPARDVTAARRAVARTRSHRGYVRGGGA